MISVHVVYVCPDKQCVLSLQVRENCTIEGVIDCSGIRDRFPEIDLMTMKVGVFSRLKKLTDTVKEGDRVEIYRPLVIDPKEARRMREKKQS